MESSSEFLEFCRGKYSRKDLKLISFALEYTHKNLKGERKFSGKDLREFNIDVAANLVRSKLPVEVVVSGILYATEKTLPFEEIARNFGEEIAEIVFGQLKFRRIKKKNVDVEAEVVRKILITGLDDVRIIFVKLAAKLANLRIISFLPEKEQKRICKDILDIYVPLAMRLGLDYIKNNLEDLAFKNLHPRKHEEISNFFRESRQEREAFIKKFIGELGEVLRRRVSIVRIKGRDKQIRSIYKKIVNRGQSLTQQRDHYAIRIIVKTEKDCYDCLGILHERYTPVSGRLKDYISSPRQNGYQSIHTAIKIAGNREKGVGSREKEVEVQIRTREMDEFAEEGGAAHWNYKAGKGDASFEKKVGWLRAVMDSQKGASDKEFMRNLKLDLFADKIYCYTPKGDVRELAKGSTLLDFAYSIHQEVGEKAIGGRIDGKFVSLKEVLKNGAVVEILTNKNQRPRRDWLKFVVSTRAKAKIRKGIRRYESIPVPKFQNIVVKKEGDFDSLVESPGFSLAEFAFAKCCYPLPKDELIGVQKSHRKILVHKSDCKKLTGSMKNALQVFWKESFNRPLKLGVLCSDRSGVLSDLLNTISSGGFIVREASAKIVGNENVLCNFVVIPKELDEVVRLVGRVRRVRSVLQVFFE